MPINIYKDLQIGLINFSRDIRVYAEKILKETDKNSKSILSHNLNELIMDKAVQCLDDVSKICREMSYAEYPDLQLYANEHDRFLEFIFGISSILRMYAKVAYEKNDQNGWSDIEMISSDIEGLIAKTNI